MVQNHFCVGTNRHIINVELAPAHRRHHSTETSLLYCTSIAIGSQKNFLVSVSLTSAAFDTIDHDIYSLGFHPGSASMLCARLV